MLRAKIVHVLKVWFSLKSISSMSYRQIHTKMFKYELKINRPHFQHKGNVFVSIIPYEFLFAKKSFACPHPNTKSIHHHRQGHLCVCTLASSNNIPSEGTRRKCVHTQSKPIKILQVNAQFVRITIRVMMQTRYVFK